VIETLEDIEELKECYSNLGLDKLPQETSGKSSLKKAKKTSEDMSAKKEAQSVLIDFLTSMLTKPQSFLRDVANSCFKQFSVEFMDEESLGRLLGIVATPNAEAGGFMDAKGDEEEEASGDELSQASIDEDDSDDVSDSD